MVSLNTLKPGDVVYDCHREKMGNTTVTRLGVWEVRIVEVHADSPSPHVIARWNGNAAKKFYARTVAKWRRSKHQAQERK